MSSYTVIGLWLEDEAVVAGVVAGTVVPRRSRQGGKVKEGRIMSNEVKRAGVRYNHATSNWIVLPGHNRRIKVISPTTGRAITKLFDTREEAQADLDARRVATNDW